MIVVGATISGCVRATAVDAFSLNYRVTLAEEGGFDRSEASHAVSLCDMHANTPTWCNRGACMPDTELGKHAVAGYSRYLGMSAADFIKSMDR